MRIAYALFVLLLLQGGIATSGAAQGAQEGHSSAPTMNAVRVEAALSVDGRLDEAAWHEAPPVTGFRQFEPTEGAAPTQRTEVRVLYGNDHLYVGARLDDEQPRGIEQTLGRRDEYNRADWFLVSIDSYLDRRTARIFGVNAAGVQYDAIERQGSGGPGGPGDNSWDAVWYSGVRVTPTGWLVEMRIPYSMLRFANEGAQTWGIHFRRRMPRRGEEVEWPLVPRTERSNLVAQFGRLTGISGIEPKRNVQVRPYTVSRLQMEESAAEPGTAAMHGSADVGGDIKIGLGPNVTLDATVNPDFGQVEADPAVLNLTAFETFFEERRPFFIDGIQLYEFSVGPGELLYTRRIGAQAPIVGATKLSGRTASDLSFGVLGATTGAGFSPNRHYGVARMSQQLGDYSSVGGIVTGFDGPVPGAPERRRSYSGGADWDLRLRDNRYGIEGFASVTHRRGPTVVSGAETGLAGKVWMRRRQGAVTGFAGLDVFGDAFNPNDLGQLRENNFVAAISSMDYEIKGGQAFGPFQRASIEGFGIQQFAYDDGLNLGQRFELESRWTLRDFQQVEFNTTLQNPFGGYDLYETRGLGPWAEPFGIGVSSEFETDERRSWQIEPEIEVTFNDDGGREYAAGLRSDVDVGTRLSLSANLEGEWERGVTAWTSNETFRRTEAGAWGIGAASAPPTQLDAGDYVAFDDRGRLDAVLTDVAPYSPDHYYVPVFGARDTRSLDLTLRSTVTFMQDLSLQVYSQLFLARGRYDRFQVLVNRDELVPFDPFPKRDEFALSSLQSNVVLRWEYRPGSTLYVVWTHGRRANDALNPLAPWEASPYDRPIDEQVAETFDIFPRNVFLIKLNYTFLY
jgi:hypothetical protein